MGKRKPEGRAATGEQLPIALEHRPALGRVEFLVSGANEAAVRAVLDWRRWPDRRLALIGPEGAGKTHLAHVWMQEAGAERVAARALCGADVPLLLSSGPLVVEDVEEVAKLSAAERRSAEEALFHLLNLARAEGRWVLLTGREAPGRWPIEMPDLASRLTAMPMARIAPPDDSLMAGLLVKLFADRQLRVSPEVVRYLATRLDRSYVALGRAVDALDRRSLATGRRVSRALAADYLAEVRARGAAGAVACPEQEG